MMFSRDWLIQDTLTWSINAFCFSCGRQWERTKRRLARRDLAGPTQPEHHLSKRAVGQLEAKVMEVPGDRHFSRLTVIQSGRLDL